MRKVALGAVIGHPISHSLSPDIFQFLSRKLEVPMAYQAMDIRPEELGSMLLAMRRIRFTGWNVTHPHKQRIMRHMDEISAQARLVGAVNVVTQS